MRNITKEYKGYRHVLFINWLDGSLSRKGRKKVRMSVEAQIKKRIEILKSINSPRLAEMIEQSIDELEWVLGLLNQELK